ncbi:hypothetical protein LY76DRAFT_597777 [Colletotrichum caudatum]|nr:hypothetical protein LY76DRAFT_597777 [Colletotrichum caudatum]
MNASTLVFGLVPSSQVSPTTCSEPGIRPMAKETCPLAALVLDYGTLSSVVQVCGIQCSSSVSETPQHLDSICERSAPSLLSHGRGGRYFKSFELIRTRAVKVVQRVRALLAQSLLGARVF